MTTTERRILHAAGQALKQTTGIDAKIHPAPTGQDRGADAVVDLLVEGRKHRFHAEVKTVDRFATPASIQARGQKWPEPPLLVAPFITHEVAERCRQLHLPFIDTAGKIPFRMNVSFRRHREALTQLKEKVWCSCEGGERSYVIHFRLPGSGSLNCFQGAQQQ